MPPCYVYHQSQGVAISSADRYTGPEAYGLLTGWIYPQWTSNDTLLRSYSGATMNDDAVFTRVGPGLGDTQLDPWFYDDKQGYGVDDVELSHDLKTVVGIAGDSSERLRTYRTTTAPFGAPDWDHTPFTNKVNVPAAERCSELTGAQFESTSLAPDARGLAYGTKEGVWVTPLSGCQAGGAREAADPGGRFPDWGPAGLPAAAAAKPSLRVARAARRKIVVKVRAGGPGAVKATAVVRGRKVRLGPGEDRCVGRRPGARQGEAAARGEGDREGRVPAGRRGRAERRGAGRRCARPGRGRAARSVTRGPRPSRSSRRCRRASSGRPPS